MSSGSDLRHVAEAPSPSLDGHRLTPQQKTYFETFGFVRIKGLFRDEIATISAAFDELFAQGPTWETTSSLHFDDRRLTIPGFIQQHPDLIGLRHDPRLLGIVTSILGDRYEYAESDGNIFSCDTSWHPDNYAAPMEVHHAKFSFYLDPVDADSGAIRMMPGTNDWRSAYAEAVRRGTSDPLRIEDVYGVPPDELPAWTVESQPGDLIVSNFRTIHGAFNGGDRRRMFTMNFKEA